MNDINTKHLYIGGNKQVKTIILMKYYCKIPDFYTREPYVENEVTIIIVLRCYLIQDVL